MGAGKWVSSRACAAVRVVANEGLMAASGENGEWLRRLPAKRMGRKLGSFSFPKAENICVCEGVCTD